MNNIEVKEKFKKEKNVIYIYKINYKGKVYAKTLKRLKNGIEYIYFEIDNDTIKEIVDEKVIFYLKENYNEETSDIIY